MCVLFIFICIQYDYQVKEEEGLLLAELPSLIKVKKSPVLEGSKLALLIILCSLMCCAGCICLSGSLGFKC